MLAGKIGSLGSAARSRRVSSKCFASSSIAQRSAVRTAPGWRAAVSRPAGSLVQAHRSAAGWLQVKSILHGSAGRFVAKGSPPGFLNIEF